MLFRSLQKLHHCTVIELPNSALRAPAVDPLNEDLYFRAHRKFERQEKQLRNIERDRAQHEQQQLDRLLEDLRGQDWLRVMGLTGVHENEKSLYEPKRQILIQELVALVKKFQKWKDEEKRRKTAKDKPLLPAEGLESQSQTQPQAQLQSQPQQQKPRQRPQKKPQMPTDISDEGSPLTDTPSTPPDPHDVDALAARQLHQEARSASAAKHRKSISEPRKPSKSTNDDPNPKPTKQNSNTKDPLKRQKTLLDMNFISSPTQTPPLPPPPPPPPPPDKPFTSFFQDRTARDTAVAVIDGTPHSRTQTILAFGHPIPEAEEEDFEPPPEILTEEAIYSSRRQMRRLKRQSRG